MKIWKSWQIYYWDYPASDWINDCFGNSVSMTVTARSLEEALKKAKNLAGDVFRFNKVICGDNGIFATYDRYSLNSEQKARYC